MKKLSLEEIEKVLNQIVTKASNPDTDNED